MKNTFLWTLAAVSGALLMSVIPGYPAQAKVHTNEKARLQQEVKTMKFEENMMQAENQAIAKEEKEMNALDAKMIATEKESVKSDEQRIKVDESRLVKCQALMTKHENEMNVANISDKSRKYHENAVKVQALHLARVEQRLDNDKKNLAADKEKLKSHEKLFKIAKN